MERWIVAGTDIEKKEQYPNISNPNGLSWEEWNVQPHSKASDFASNSFQPLRVTPPLEDFQWEKGGWENSGCAQAIAASIPAHLKCPAESQAVAGGTPHGVVVVDIRDKLQKNYVLFREWDK